MTKVSEWRKKKKWVKTPGGTTKQRFDKPRKGIVRCGLCKEKLKGASYQSENMKKSKTQKRPDAPFGGALCAGCRENILKQAIQVKENLKAKEKISVRHGPWVDQALQVLEG